MGRTPIGGCNMSRIWQNTGKVYGTKYVATQGIQVFEGGEFSQHEDGPTYYYTGQAGSAYSIQHGPNDWTTDPEEAKRRAIKALRAKLASVAKQTEKLTKAIQDLETWSG